MGNGSPPSRWDSYADERDDEAYSKALAETDTCDNSSCPRGHDEPATYTLVVDRFDESSEEFYEQLFRVCSACNRSCKRSFLGHKIKSRRFDKSTRDSRPGQGPSKTAVDATPPCRSDLPREDQPLVRRTGPVPGSALYAQEHPADTVSISTIFKNDAPAEAFDSVVGDSCSPAADPSLSAIASLQDALRILNERPPTPAAFVASIRVRHDNNCLHDVNLCSICSHGLICCACHQLFVPAVARHLACFSCKHVASVCCNSACCCKCFKIWSPQDSIGPIHVPARRFFGGANSNSSPEPDIWTPSPRSSPDEIDDLTARANIPLPTSRSESDASRAPSRASSVDVPVNVAATPLPTPDFSSLADNAVDGLIHPSFPDRTVLDSTDKRHFLGRGDLSVTSLKLYARRIFLDTSHWITAGHFLVDIFQGSTLNGSRDDFRHFVILVGTQLGFGDLALSMSESLDVNRKMADEYMRLRDVATSWKQKAKTNSKDARAGRCAQEELSKAEEDIAAILEEREVFIQQRREFLAKNDQLTTELNRVHKDYGNTIEDNTKLAANVDTLEQKLTDATNKLSKTENLLSMAFFFFFLDERMYLLSTTNTPGTLIRNASRRDALAGVVDDYLMRYTRGIEEANKWPEAPTKQRKV